jgi:opacity protein-like surface antigen
MAMTHLSSSGAERCGTFLPGDRMFKSLTMIACLACVLCASAPAGAQALPTATARGSLQIGGGYTIASPDYGQKDIKGVSGFADFDLAPHYGLEAIVNYISLVTPTDLAENSYLIGPRIMFPRGRFTLYGKLLGGYGDLVIQEFQDNVGRPDGFYFEYALGGGLDIRATDRITIRAMDIELQKWPSYGNGLSPVAYTVGAAYHFR